MAPCSSASRDIVVKMVTPVSGNLERSGTWMRMGRYQVSGYRFEGLLHKLRRPQREDRVLVPQRDDAIRVGVLGKLSAQQPRAQRAQLIAIEVVDELAHQLGRRRRTRLDAVRLQRRQHVAAVAVFHRVRLRRTARIAHPLTYVTPSDRPKD